MIAGDDSLLLGMIKAARLIIRQNLSCFSGLRAPQKSREEIDLDGNLAGRTPNKVRGIIAACRNRLMTPCARDLFHAF
jgi:hypothetical protein